jgi:hypothetical protein
MTTAQATAAGETPKATEKGQSCATSRARCAREGQVGEEGQLPGGERKPGNSQEGFQVKLDWERLSAVAGWLAALLGANGAVRARRPPLDRKAGRVGPPRVFPSAVPSSMLTASCISRPPTARLVAAR